MGGDGIRIGLFSFFAIAFKGYGKERIFEEKISKGLNGNKLVCIRRLKTSKKHIQGETTGAYIHDLKAS